MKKYFWKIELRNFGGKLFIDLDFKPKRDNHENELKFTEFLEVGIEMVKDYIELKEIKKNIIYNYFLYPFINFQ
jgi:hypothetical protein